MNAIFENRYVLLDGAMGTMLMEKGLDVSNGSEIYNISHPEIIQEIHEEYLASGSSIIYANTFVSSKLKNSNGSYQEQITSGVRAAKSAAKEFNGLVALDVGPLGELLEPMGTLEFETAYDIFKDKILIGVKAGADLIAIETMTDLYEAKAAVLAAKENCNLPVIATMSFEKNMKTFAGTDIKAMAVTLEDLGADAIGINCSLGPLEILPIAKVLAKYTNLPLVIKANAGLPQSNEYQINEQEFAKAYKEFVELGVTVLGGCCGTNPKYIEELEKLLSDKKPFSRVPVDTSYLSSYSTIIRRDEAENIAFLHEYINDIQLTESLNDGNEDDILDIIFDLTDDEVDLIEIDLDACKVDREVQVTKLIKIITSVCKIPLFVFSENKKLLYSAKRIYNGKCTL